MGRDIGWGTMYIEASQSFRAPIFYDSNNTGYYTDPASTSRLNVINCGDVYNDLGGWFRNYNSTGIYNQTYGNHFYSDSATYWNVGSNGNGFGIRLRHSYAGTIAGYLYGEYSNNFGLLNQSGSWKVRVNGADTEIYDYLYWNDGRGYIFYDRNNTGYYVDPASSSYFNAATCVGSWYFQSNLGATSGSLAGPPLQAYSTNNNSAFMSFHKGGYYAINMGLDSDNVFRIGGWSAAANRLQMDMSGNLTMAGNVTAFSDIRLKDNITIIDNALEKVLHLNGVTFTRTDHEDKDKRHAGVIAQEVEKVFPEVVSEDNQGIKNIAYGNMIGLLIEAIKEQQRDINNLKQQINQLKNYD
jgi:hypothetical protein